MSHASKTVLKILTCRLESTAVIPGKDQFGFYQRDVVSGVFATAMWLAGWLDVARRYCIKTAKPILKLFRPSGSPIILVLDTPCRYPIPRGTPSAGVLNTREWEKLAIFHGNRRLSRKWCEIGRWLLWNINRKS